jgi:precorrin-3B synthase
VPYLTAIVRRVRTAGPTEAIPVVRGECPTVHRPFDQVDGSLVRVRVPGGIVTADRMRQVAAVAVRGTGVEITSRANLQIRGTARGDEREITRLLVAAGVTHHDALADSRRNVVASPTSGHDPEEIVDCRPLVADIEARLAAHRGGSLSPKFGVLIDGGGMVNVRGQSHDVCLGAVRHEHGSPRLEVSLGRGLASADRTGPAAYLQPEGVVPFVTAVLEAIEATPATAGRASGLVTAMKMNQPEAIASIARSAHIELEVGAPAMADLRRGPSVRPIGVLDDRRSDLRMVGAMPILGRLSAETLDAIAGLAARFGDREVRLTPWRSVLFAGVALDDVEPLQAALGALDLVVEPTDPALDVVACAGSTGCPSGLTDAQADGRQLIEMLRHAPQTRGVSVHVSGCSKRCAAGDRPFAVTLEGGPNEGSYTVTLENGPETGPHSPVDALRSAVGLAT